MKPIKAIAFSRELCLRPHPEMAVGAEIRLATGAVTTAFGSIAPVFVPAMRQFLRLSPDRVSSRQPANTGAWRAGTALDRIGQDRGQQRRLVGCQVRGRTAKGVFGARIGSELTRRPKLGDIEIDLQDPL